MPFDLNIFFHDLSSTSDQSMDSDWKTMRLTNSSWSEWEMRGPLCEDRLRRHWTGPEASPLHASENITGRDNRRIHLHCGEILVPMFSSIPVSFYFSFIFHTDRDIFTRSNPTTAPTKWKIPKVSIRLDEPPCSKETIKQYHRSINRHGRKRNGSRKNWIWWASETGYLVFRGSSRCILKVTEC